MNYCLYYDDRTSRVQSRPERRPIIVAIANYWQNQNIDKLYESDCRTFFKDGPYLLLRDFMQDFQEIYYFNVSAQMEGKETIPMGFMGDLFIRILKKHEALDYFLNDYVEHWTIKVISSDDYEGGHHISVKDLLNLATEEFHERIDLWFNDFIIPQMSIDLCEFDELPISIDDENGMADYFLLLLSLALSAPLNSFEKHKTEEGTD